MRRASIALAVAVAALALAPRAGAQAPVGIRSASLSQQGQDLVWRVRLEHAFSGASLKRDQASLCLLIERWSGAVRDTVCVVPGRHGRPPPRLALLLGAGHRVISAAVTRAGADGLRASFLPSAIGLGYTRLRWQTQTSTTTTTISLVPGHPAPLELHTPKLVGCVASGAAFVSHGPGNGRMIALTFDDGPWYDTPQFLGVLERERVVATFFQIGEQIGRYGGVDRRILRDGDMIGDHTWSHANVTGDGSFAASQIGMTAAAIRQATGGFSPCLFRAPGGAVSQPLIPDARRMGFTTIQWDIDPRDWSRPGTGAIYNNVISNAHPGAIVLQHDGGGDRSETLAALPREIATLRRRGYRFVTITQMLGYRLLYK